MPTTFSEYMAMSAEMQAKLNKSEEEKPLPTPTPIEAREGFTFGCDPELFVFKGGKAVTAEGLIPGTKAKPYAVKNGAVQVDGMAAEFNIAPAKTFKEFNHNIESVMKQLTEMLPEGHELRAVPSVVFDEDTYDAAPEKAKELGCSPDYNAWDGCVNPPPSDPDNPRLRTASGHLHIGWTEGADLSDAQHVMNCRDIVKQFDWYLGAWSCQMDSDPIRRRLYGQAGAMRFKDYGVEYRVLSNFWITSRDRRLAIWNRMQTAINAMADNYLPEKARDFNDRLVKSINQSVIDPELAANHKYPLSSLLPTGRRRGSSYGLVSETINSSW